MDLRPMQAKKIVELHRVQRTAQFDELAWRFVKLAAFVVRADDENAHVPRGGGLDRRPVEVVDEIPVEIDVIELAALDGLQDDIGCRVCGKSKEAHAAIALQLARRRDATVLL